ncbi:histidine kinase [Pseudanabaena sp. SR411]|uniref:sensor histidine kinase n=1 Tax=Pseudanabaena sp. SR411 TaxID=1980935 RepID=UPI000B982B4A|nr:ATP-binding protein [Pseudanabaena sp. SR411]OYQ63618.1 histidine kinase [Pseudanabaena sp. SR411]
MKWNLERKLIAGGLGAALLIMGTMSWISYQNAIQLIRSTERIKRTYSTLEHLADIQATLNEAESGRRGYLLFGTDFELERYNLAIAKLVKILNDLEQSLGNQVSQNARFQQLRSLIDQRQKLFQTSNTLFRLNPSDLSANHPLVIASRINREALREVFIALKAEEQSSLELWIARSGNNMQYRLAIESVGTLISFTIFLSVYLVLYHQLLKRQEAERMQQKLAQEKELSELKLEFLALVSHEFRTPLSVILGSAQLLKDSLSSQIERSRLRSLTRIESSAKAMKQMFADVLTIARADAGKLEYQPSWLELQSFCLNLVEDMQLSDQYQHVIKLIDLGDRTHGWLDEALIYSALSNLLSNAIKYAPVGSNIDFILDGKIDVITFQVKDEGMGISPEEQVTLFEPFTRGVNVKSIIGTGLGLALVKRCIDLHQGEITIDSEVGVGTTFTIQIPQSRLEK